MDQADGQPQGDPERSQEQFQSPQIAALKVETPKDTQHGVVLKEDEQVLSHAQTADTPAESEAQGMPSIPTSSQPKALPEREEEVAAVPSEEEYVPLLKSLYDNKLFKFYGCYSGLAWAKGTWDFAMALMLYRLSHGTLLLPAAYGLTCALLVGMLIPLMDRYVFHGIRLQFAMIALSVGAASTCLALGLLVLLFAEGLGGSYLAVLLIISAAIASVCSAGVEMSLSGLWVPTMGETEEEHREIRSGIHNANLMAQILSPAIAGLLLSAWRPLVCAVCVAVIALTASLVAFLWLPEVHATSDMQAAPVPVRQRRLGLVETMRMVRTFFGQNVAPAAIAKAVMYLTVLTFSYILIAYLYSQAVTPLLIAVYVALSVALGGVLDVSFVELRKFATAVAVGNIGIWWTISCLALCVASTFFTKTWAIVLLVGGVILAEAGVVCFEYAIAALICDRVHPDNARAVLCTAQDMRSIFLVAIFAVSMIFHHPGQFHVLVYVSFAATLVSGVIYSCWSFSKKNTAWDQLVTEADDGQERNPLLPPSSLPAYV